MLDKTVLFRFSAVVPRQVFKSSIFLSRGTPTASGQNTPQASPRARSTRYSNLSARFVDLIIQSQMHPAGCFIDRLMAQHSRVSL